MVCYFAHSEQYLKSLGSLCIHVVYINNGRSDVFTRKNNLTI